MKIENDNSTTKGLVVSWIIQDLRYSFFLFIAFDRLIHVSSGRWNCLEILNRVVQPSRYAQIRMKSQKVRFCKTLRIKNTPRHFLWFTYLIARCLLKFKNHNNGNHATRFKSVIIIRQKLNKLILYQQFKKLMVAFLFQPKTN